MSDTNSNPPLRRSERTKKDTVTTENVLKESKTNLNESPSKVAQSKASGVAAKRKNNELKENENVEESTDEFSVKKIQKISDPQEKKADTLKADKSNLF